MSLPTPLNQTLRIILRILLPFVLATLGLIVFIGIFNVQIRVQAAGSVLYVSAATGSDVGDCKTQSAPCDTIAYALTQAASGEEIRVAQGTYVENLTVNQSVILRGGFSTSDWVDFAPTDNPTIIDGASSGRVLQVQNVTTITIEGFHVRNGLVNTGATPDEGSGAGINIINSGAIIRHNRIYENSTAVAGSIIYGGGIHVNTGASNVIIEHNEIYSNTVQTTLPNVGGGGGIGNQAPNTTIIRQNQIYDNSASGTLAFGGGVYNFNGLMDLSANTIYQNTADSVGGGLMNHGTATATIISNIIYDNQSSGGGGIYNIEGTAFVWNNTIVENVTTGSDGGGGIKNENGAVTISNTIIMSNTDNAGPNDIDFFDGGTIEAFYSRIDNIDAGTPFTSNNDVLVDPDFVDPAQNDFHLLDSSSMIDAGDPASAPAIDIDGQARPFGGDTAYDVGADEVYHSTTCFAQMANGTVLDNLQDAVNLASDGDTIKVAGYCTDEENDGSVLFINSKSITVRGGYTTTNWSSPSGSPTILDAENHGARRVVHLTGNATFTSTVEGFYITGGDIEENGGGVLVENGITAIIQNNFIYFNRVTDPMEGGDRNGAGIATSNSRAIIQFNTFYSNTNTVIYNDGAQPSIVNNLIIEHSDGAAINSANGILPEAIANNVIFNSGSEITFDGTLFGRTLPDAYGNIDVDPGLVDPENGDFHLQTTSPVIGQAGPEIVAITMDIDGDDRPQGDSSDIGADETIKYRQLLFNADQIGNADVGGAVTYTHILTNAGTFTESVGLGFTLSTGWDFAVSPVGPFTLDPGESTTFNMVITIPVVGVSPRDEAIAVFTATSQLESQVIATTQDTTFVNITPGAELTPNYDLNFDPGTEITVIHTLTNTGNYTDSYVISSSPITGSWGRLAVTSPYTIELGQLEAIAIPVIISVPHTALPKAENQNIFFITAARSDFGPDLTVTATNIIEANSIDGDRYVDIEQGFDEDNNCTVSDTPCKTIGHGLGLVTVSDAVFVARGTYSESGLIINNTIRLLGGYTSDFEEANRLMNPDETTIDGTGLGNRVILIGKNSPTIENFTIKGGDVSGLGGGIQVSEQASDPILRQLILTNNQATQGGGLYIGQDSAELANLVLFGNSATDSGGGIYLNNSDVTIQNLTLVENTASADGGGIYIAGGTTLVTNTLVASNTAGNDGGGIYQVAGSVDMNYNNFFANTATNNFDDSNIAFGSNSLFVVPHVDASRSMRLRITSPLIDIADPHTNNEIDFEGDLRPVDQGFDIGADEFAGCLAKIVRTDEIFGAIQEAIDAAITDDTIYVSGHCRGVTARLVAGQILSQTALITTNLTIIGGWDSIFENQNVIEPAIIDAETLGRSLVITGDITVQINHLKFINGDAAGLGGGPGDQDAGGNIYNHTSNANFHQIVVQEGTAEVGGGFYNVIGSPTFTNTSELILPNWFISNTATISGGGFYNQSGMPLFGNTRISGNDVTPSGVGGGFYNQNGQPQFTDNRNKIMLNQAESGAGFFNERGQPDLMNLTIVTNTATLNGGALFNLNNSPSYTVANLLLFHNNAMNGGAVYNTGRLNIWHTNLYSNSANTGGAVFQAAGALTVANTLVVSNFATTTSGGIHAAGGTFTLTHNNYFGNTNNDANVPLGEGHLTEDPLFLDPITPNSEDFELDPLSLVIDKGTDANFLKSDFTGTFRPSNQGYDIGARELGGCKAVINNDLSTIYNDVQSAVDAALSPTDVIRVHGHCRGVHTVEIDAQTYTQTIHLTKSLTLQGGWDETFTEQIAVTKLDALERGHVILIADPANVIVEHFDITGGLNGAIYNLSSISSTIQQNNFYSNTGTTGGAVYNDGGNIIIGGANRIYSNTVEFGTVLYSTGGTPRLQNNFIYSNTTTQNGTVYIDGGTPQIWHNTFAHNTANSGSGVYRAGGVMDIRGNIFVNGTGDVLVDGGSGSAGLIAYNNIANNAGANGSMEGTNIVTDDPQLIVDREGAEVTYRIDLTSPAFDAGDDSLFAHLQVDFENHIRPSHQTMDLGADEIDGCYAWINEDISQVYGSPQYAIDLVGSEPNIVDVAGICYGANNRNGTAQNLYIDKDLDLRGGWDVSIINNDLSTFTFTNRVTKTILNPLTEGRGLTLSGTNSIIIDRFHVYNGLLTSEDGGGLYNNNTDTFLRNNVFYNNLARNGGAIYNSAAATLQLWHNTMFSNIATDLDGGGGLYIAGGTATVRNNVFLSNTAPLGEAIREIDGTIDIDYNRIGASEYSGVGSVGANNIELLPGFISTDPNNENFLKLTAGSPVVDVADPNAATAAGLGVSDDFENHPRPSDQGYDMGADEYAVCLAKIVRTGIIYGHIQEAIDASLLGDAIQVHGTCTPQPGDAQVVEITVDSLSLSGGWDEEFSGQSETTPTRLDGLSTGRVILLDNDAFNATFSTFTLQNGSATNGGLVYNAGTLSLSTVNMSNGQATNGGGIYNDDGGSITMVTVEIISTTATQNGGAIHNVNNATLDMQDIDILTAIADQNGGGIYNMGTIARLNNLDESNGNLIAFAQAVNGDGGGIYNNSDIDQMFGTFVFSSSAGSEGGGMYNGSSGVVDQLQTSDFDESFAPIAGGGLYNSGTIDYSQSTYFTENTSALGAGLYSSGSIYIQNAYFFSNTATNDGGGIYIDQTGSSRFVHNTIRKNVANNRGGGMFVANGSVVMTNSLIVENQAPGGGGGIHGSGGTVVVDYSNYWNNTPDNSTGVTNQSNNIGPVNPKFSSETFFALDPSSPVIDRGDSGVSVDCCIHPDYPQPPIRPQNNGFDLGAWEEWVRYEVLFTPDDGETLAPGSVITYVHSVNNIGNITDTYTISVQDPGMNWYTNLTPTEITLGPGDSYLTVLLTVQVPEDALSGEQDTVVLLAQSQTVTTTQDTVLDETTVDTIYRWEIAPDNRGQALPGTSLAYSHLVTNTGNITDTARFKIFINDDYASVPEISVLAQGTEITKNPQSGTYSTEPLTVTLAPGESTWVTNTVEFVDWVAGDIEVLNNVIVRSEGNLDFQTAAANTTIISFTTGTRYVDPEGNDQSSDDEDITVNDNNCTTTSNPGPCKTIAHALSQAMPGDTIALLGNVTFTELTTATVGTDQVNQVIYLDKGVTIQGGYDTNWNRIDPFEYPTVLQVPVGGRGIYITGTIEAAIAGVTISGANPSYTDSNGGAIYNDGANLTVNANILHDNQAAEGSAIYNTSTGVITIQNNFIYSNTQSPAIYVADGQARIENNSFFDNDPTGAPDTGAAIEIQAGDLWSSNNIFADSVVDETSAVLVAGTANATITTNIYDGYTTPVSGDTDAASLIVDPEFINPASGNLHIGATSPALEAGLLLSTVTTDIDGNVRPIAATHDIGADEREFEAGLEFTPDYISSTNNINHIFTYTHFITNTGQVTDTFTLSHSSSAGWDVMIVPQMITLSGALTGTQQSGVITVSIAVTGASQGGVTDITRITATSRVSATLSEMVTNTSSVVQSFGLTFTPDQTKTTMADSIIYTHTLTNNGNGTDTFTFITATDPANWTVQPITPIQLSANTTATVEVVILIPVDSGGITNTTTITAVSSGAQTAAVVDTTYVDFERGVAIDPDRSGSALPGDVITYTHTLTNTGNASDSFTITRSSNVPTGWTVDFTPQTIASLPGGSSVPVTVTVTVPNTASLAISGTTHVLTLTATSAADPGGSTDIAVDTTTIGLDVQLILEALDPVSQALTVETVVTYTHRITNAGNLTDTVSFTVSNSLAGFGWSTEPTPIPTLILAPDESQTFVITLTVPVPPGGAANITTITATSSFSAGLIYDTSVNTTTVTPVYSVSLVQDEIALVVADAVTATFVHTVTNLGNVQESFALDSFSSLPGWGVTISPTLVTLNPAVSQTISVLVTIPTNSGGLTNTVQITATSVTDTSASATVTETIIVPIDLGVLIEPDRVLAGQPGVTLSYTHTVTNLGNVTDSFTFTIVGTSLPGWVITPSPSRVENLPGSSSQIVTVTVQIPLTPSLALSGTVQVFTPTIVSDADPVTIRDTVVDTTTIGLTPSVIIEGLAPITRTLMGENLVTYTHVITNQGNFTDSIDLTLSNSLAAFGWTFEPDPLPTLLLGPNQSSSLVITLTVPPPGGSNINVTVITATSSYTNMGLVYDTSTNTTTVTSVYSVSLVKPEALVVAPDAITTTIVHTITNLGNVPDTYSITVQSANPAWVITPDPSTITLAASLSDTITLTVQIPASSGGTSNIFTTTATSQNDDTPPNAFATVTDTVTVPLTRGVQIEPDLTLSGQPGQVLTFSHILTNTGNSVDSFTLAILPDSLPGWQVTIVPTNVASLAGSDSVPVTVVVEIPVTNTQALSGTAHTTLITATSVASPATVIDTATDTSIVTALANIIFEADISITTDQTLVTHTHTITNQGNTTDTLTMAYASSLGWAQTLVPSPTVQLAPSQSAAVTLTLVVPIGSGGLTDITVISATSTVNPAISASVVDSTTISQTAGVRFTPDRIGIADPDTVVYTHTLENLGNGPDVFTFTASHSVPGWTIDLVEPVALLSAETTTVVITATVPPNSGNLVNTSIITAVSNADITITDSVTETTTVPQVLGVIIEPEQTLSGVPGQVLTFSHTLTNSGNVTDSVSLIASSVRGWDVTISPTLTTILNGGASTLVEVTVTLPLTGLDSYSGTVDTIVVTATSILSPTITDTTTDTVTIEAVPAVQIEPDYSVNAFAGNIISFTHTVTNAGNLTDTISINSANSAGWDVTTLMPITLFPGQSTTIIISVTVDAVTATEINTTTVTVTSGFDGSVSDQAIDVITASPSSAGVGLEPDNASTANSGSIISYQHVLTNLGDTDDTFTFEAASSQGWIINPVNGITLSPNQTRTVTIQIIIPINSGGLVDTTVVTATSSRDTTVFATAINTTTVNQMHDLAWHLLSATNPVSTSTNIAYTYVITNSGDGVETLDITAFSDLGWSFILPGTLSIPAGDQQTVVLTVIVPTGSGGLTSAIAFTTTSTISPSNVLSDDHQISIPLARSLRFIADQSSFALPGDTLMYTHFLTNTGNSTDTFNLTFTQNLPWGSVSPNVVTLNAGEQTTVQVSVSVPNNLAGETVHTIVVTASSNLSPTLAVDTVTDVTTYREVSIYLPVVMKNASADTSTPTPTPTPTVTPTATPAPVSGVDLVVTDLTLIPSSPISGQQVTVQVTIRNQGNVNVSFGNNFFVDFYVNLTDPDPTFAGDIFWSVQGVELSAGASKTLTGQYTFADGVYTLHSKVDTQDDVKNEVNESNNLFGPTILNVGNVTAREEGDPVPVPEPTKAVTPRATVTPQP